MSLADIDLRLAELESQFQNLLAEAAEGSYQDYTAQFKSIADEMASLKEKEDRSGNTEKRLRSNHPVRSGGDGSYEECLVRTHAMG